MNNVIIPYNLSAIQERDHLVYDKINKVPMILKRGTFVRSSYDTNRYSLPHSQVMCVRDGNVLSAPLDTDGTAMWAQSSFYKITGLTYPCTLNVSAYVTSNASTGIVSTTVTGNDAASLASAIKAIHSYVAKVEVLTDGIGIQLNSYNTSDMSNAIYTRMRFRITGDNATKVDNQTVTIGSITLYMMDEYVYQCQSAKDILKLKGIGVPPYQSYPWRLSGNAGGPVFHLAKAVSYYATNGKATFDKSNTMTKAMFDSLATSTVAEQKAYWEKYNGSYSTYIARTYMDIDSVCGGNTIFNDIKYLTNILGSIKTLDYNNNEIAAYPSISKSLTYGFDDAIHASGNWLGADFLFISLLMRRTGKDSSNKTEWDKEMLLVGGVPTYSGKTIWLSCCEYGSNHGLLFYGTDGSYGANLKHSSHYVVPFLAFHI